MPRRWCRPRPACRAARSMPGRSSSRPHGADRNGGPRTGDDGRKRARRSRRRSAFRFGLQAEKRAALWLMLKGYRILSHRYARQAARSTSWPCAAARSPSWRSRRGRICDDAAVAITQVKRRRLLRAARDLAGPAPLGGRPCLEGRRGLRRAPPLAEPPRERVRARPSLDRGAPCPCVRATVDEGNPAWPLRGEPPPKGSPMSLRVAVQMDPIERINIAGDSTFALMLEAQERGHSLVLLHARAALDAGRARRRQVRPRARCATSPAIIHARRAPTASTSPRWTSC